MSVNVLFAAGDDLWPDYEAPLRDAVEQAGLTDDELEQIAQLCKAVRVSAGKAIFKEGDSGDEMFITIGNFKREMILPAVLAKRRAAGGALRDGMLEIDFLPLKTTEETAVVPPGIA